MLVAEALLLEYSTIQTYFLATEQGDHKTQYISSTLSAGNAAI